MGTNTSNTAADERPDPIRAAVSHVSAVAEEPSAEAVAKGDATEAATGTPTAGRSGVDEARRRGLGGFIQILGPGLITGASDDDPSGIGTYYAGGQPVRSRHALAGALHLSTHDRGPGSMCADRAPDRRRPGDVTAAEVPLAPRRRLHRPGALRQHDQRRRGPRCGGGGRIAAHRQSRDTRLAGPARGAA